MKLQCEQAERKCSELIEENDRLTKDMSSVSILIICCGCFPVDNAV